MLTSDDRKLAEEIAEYYRFPERTTYSKKELLNEAKAKNKTLHYHALEINRRIWTRKRG